MPLPHDCLNVLIQATDNDRAELNHANIIAAGFYDTLYNANTIINADDYPHALRFLNQEEVSVHTTNNAGVYYVETRPVQRAETVIVDNTPTGMHETIAVAEMQNEDRVYEETLYTYITETETQTGTLINTQVNTEEEEEEWDEDDLDEGAEEEEEENVEVHEVTVEPATIEEPESTTNTELPDPVVSLWRRSPVWSEYATITREVLKDVIPKPIRIKAQGPHVASAHVDWSVASSYFEINILEIIRSRTDQLIFNDVSNRYTDLLTAPTSIGGFNITRQVPWHARPSGVGYPIIIDNYFVAELTQDNLFICIDCASRGSRNEKAIYRLILQKAKEVWQSDEFQDRINSLTREFARIAAERELTYHQTFIENAVRASVSPNNQQYELQRLQDRQARLAQELTDVLRRIREINLIHTGLLNVNETEHVRDQLNRILRLPKVVGFEADANYFKVKTKVLHCKDARGTYHKIGAFTIQIPYNGMDNIRFHNETHLINGLQLRMHAPHVFPNGNMCAGNLSEALPQLYHGKQYEAIVIMLILFLESVNENDSAGRYIHEWPESTEQELRDAGLL